MNKGVDTGSGGSYSYISSTVFDNLSDGPQGSGKAKAPEISRSEIEVDTVAFVGTVPA